MAGSKERSVIGVFLRFVMATGIVGVSPVAAETPASPWTIVTGPPGPVVESSGLTVDRRPAAGVPPGASPAEPDLWTHNDSGDSPSLYRINRRGEVLQTVELTNIAAKDFEDIAGVQIGQQPYLLIADVGDNGVRRPEVKLHLLPTPSPQEVVAEVTATIVVRYPGGPRDCEAVAYDPVGKKIVLVTKTKFPWCGVYTVDLPPIEDLQDINGDADRSIAATATLIRNLGLPFVTAMDIDPAGGNVMLVNYFQIFEFTGSPGQPATETLGGRPRAIATPKLRQIEAGCYDIDGRMIVTSEGDPFRMAINEGF